MKQLNAELTAVVVVDVQQGLFFSSSPPGDAVAVVDSINQVLRSARSKQVPIVFVQHTGAPGSGELEAGSPGWELHPNLDAQAGDHRFCKTMCDAFYGTGLDEFLRQRKLGTLVLAGYATDFCIDSTLRNAISRDYEVLVVADGHTTIGSAGLSSAQIRAHHNFVWSDCLSPKPVSVVPARELEFHRPA